MATKGVFSKRLVPIERDVYDITGRLKEIDSNYFIMWNRVTKRYEVHNAQQIGDTLACSLPFLQLDARAVEYVQKTSVARAKEYIEELDKANERLEEIKQKEQVLHAQEAIENIKRGCVM